MNLIAQKNDLFRRTFLGGKILTSRSVRLSSDFENILQAVKNFSNFTPENNPYGENDFGKVEVNDESYFFKIDYYDNNYEFFKEDGNRVLTIMHCSEY